MGYTHYFEVKENLDDKKFEKFVKECKLLHENLPKHSESAGSYYKENPIVICGGNGTGEPTFSKDLVCFNGTEENDLYHETFAVHKTTTEFEFCKTARKPYDLLVCACLISLKKHFGNKVSVSSNGEKNDWEPAFNFYNEITEKKVKNFIK